MKISNLSSEPKCESEQVYILKNKFVFFFCSWPYLNCALLVYWSRRQDIGRGSVPTQAAIAGPLTKQPDSLEQESQALGIQA
jgi:hypothetical protein